MLEGRGLLHDCENCDECLFTALLPGHVLVLASAKSVSSRKIVLISERSLEENLF